MDPFLLGGIAGLLVGLCMGLTGAGGGVLAVPVLVVGMGIGVQEAVPLALLAIGSAATLGSLDGLRRGLVRYRATLLMAATGVLTAALGTVLARSMPTDALMLLLCLVLIVSAVRQWPRQQTSTGRISEGMSFKPCRIDPDDGRFCWTPRCFFHIGAIGASAGLFTGLLGVGGGFLLVPFMRRYSELGMHSVIATSLAVIALVSLISVGHSVFIGTPLPGSGWIFILACATGMAMGRVLAPGLSPRHLQAGFAVLALAVAVGLATRSLIHLFT